MRDKKYFAQMAKWHLKIRMIIEIALFSISKKKKSFIKFKTIMDFPGKRKMHETLIKSIIFVCYKRPSTWKALQKSIHPLRHRPRPSKNDVKTFCLLALKFITKFLKTASRHVCSSNPSSLCQYLLFIRAHDPAALSCRAAIDPNNRGTRDNRRFDCAPREENWFGARTKRRENRTSGPGAFVAEITSAILVQRARRRLYAGVAAVAGACKKFVRIKWDLWCGLWNSTIIF